MEKKIEQYDVVIIGAGAAGLTAGIYCGRARLKTLIIEKSLVGGLATYTNDIENYPGFPEGTTGIDLMNLFQKQAKKFGVKFKFTDVKSVKLHDDEKVVETFRTNYHAKAVIVASGGKPRLTKAKNEDKYLYDKGISFCATCDAATNTDKTVMVIGSGDAAIEEGMFLTKFAKKVIVSIMHDEGKMDCNEIAKAEAFQNEKMEFVWNSVVDSFEGENHLERVILKNLKTKELYKIDVDSCFLFIGYVPNTEIFINSLNMTKHGNIITNEKMETNISGVFSAGDVRSKFLNQIVTAVGDGAIAGYAAEKYIAESEIFENQILNNGNPSLVYVYNALDADGRDKLSIIEEFEKKAATKIAVTKVDIYKSHGLVSRLGIDKSPVVVCLNNNEIIEVIKNITIERLMELI